MATQRVLALAIAIVIAIAASGCTDVREFDGTWTGIRVGEADVLRQGFARDASATLEIESVDLGTMRGVLTVTGSTEQDVFRAAPIQELPSVEADSLSELTFTSGQPARIFVTLVATGDGGGDAVVFVSLHREDRIELRILRGGSMPLYGIFFLERP